MTQEQQQIEMCGMTFAEIRRQVAEPLFPTAPTMMVMSILSDVQEMIERDLIEEARQALNRAKFILAELPA